jgi:hypothetical protein
MLWLIIGDSSHEIISCNTFFRDGKHQVWVERVNGKTLKVHESEEKSRIEEIKEAIDFAIEHGHKTLRV